MRFRPLILILTTLLTVAALLAVLSPARAQAAVQIVDPSVDYKFGQSITFRASIRADQSVREITLLFGSEADTHTRSVVLPVSPDGEVYYVYDPKDQAMRAFSVISYRYRVTLQGGQDYTSPFYTFTYADNRFDWQTLEEAPFRVHWYDGDVSLAQNVLDVARAGLQRVQSLLAVPQPEKTIDIYVYANSKDMQATLETSRQNWVAGHADPDLGVTVVALPPGPDQRLLMEQRIPHELMHIMLYQSVGTAYTNLPVWMNEGLASAAELYPNPDYQILLNNAFEKNTLLPIASLCNTFPRDASNALLAYAESASFIRFLHRIYGTSGLNMLTNSYANGLDCERGVEVALGKSLAQLERQWRQETFAENTALTSLGNLFPWLVLLVAALGAPLILSLGGLRRQSFTQS